MILHRLDKYILDPSQYSSFISNKTFFICWFDYMIAFDWIYLNEISGLSGIRFLRLRPEIEYKLTKKGNGMGGGQPLHLGKILKFGNQTFTVKKLMTINREGCTTGTKGIFITCTTFNRSRRRCLTICWIWLRSPKKYQWYEFRYTIAYKSIMQSLMGVFI